MDEARLLDSRPGAEGVPGSSRGSCREVRLGPRFPTPRGPVSAGLLHLIAALRLPSVAAIARW